METERLELIPLTAEQLKLWLENLPALERELSCSYQGEPLKDGFRSVVAGQCALISAHPADYLWGTFWLLIRKSDRSVVGSADFKRPPDGGGEVEIGYGLAPGFEHNGYMTEAVRAMTAWALKQPGVRAVTAETERYNLASQRILERCGYARYRQGETLWWKAASRGRSE
ncbi:GNAT family N-acetyltransferase [Pseudoflavonifractor phocaeensis]|uniref:GNAT family N-acetyltransferase n=1 Tax=Pseudoflavonifractor phocaeensis TaxID=1870988 RepID=UPI00210A16DA|nr:GNAT family N-acetyltransferase [Pseudoflavonifractor phocaeensis]